MNSLYQAEISITKDGANKGVKGHIDNLEDGKNMSIIVGFSRNKIYGLFISLETIDSACVKYLNAQVLQNRTKLDGDKQIQTVFVCDNAKTQKSDMIKEFVKENKIKIVTITPYSPCLNATEHLIGANKCKINSLTGSGR